MKSLKPSIFPALFVLLMVLSTGSFAAVPQQKIYPFQISQVTLLNSAFTKNMGRTCTYLLFLDKDRMLYTFRKNYNLSTQGAAVVGGWEGPTHGLRGHTMGHFLTALAQAYEATGDIRYKAKADSIVTALRACQSAAVTAGYTTGYLAAWPESKVDSLFSGKNPWAPLYCMHKTFAGLLSCYSLLGNDTALVMAKAMGKWIYTRLSPYTATQRQTFWNNMSWNAGEYGGFNEALTTLYKITSNDTFLTAAKYFDHTRLFNPCLNGIDSLSGLHANTQVPKIIGAMDIYEATGDTTYYTIAKNFHNFVTSYHTYINGGNSIGEYFRAKNAIAGQLGTTNNTCETCNIYNMLRLTRELFFYNPQPSYMDYYERALYNQILASQDTTSANGHVTYFQPMQCGGIKSFGSDLDSFRCCDGTGLENHTKYSESIYFYAGDTLFVNLFIPSQLNWTSKGMTVKMETGYPQSDTVRLTITGTGTMPLKIRAPYWIRKGVTLSIDAVAQTVTATAGSYYTLNKAWSGTSVVTIVMPQTLRYEMSPDSATTGGVMYGNQLLAGGYGTTSPGKPTLSFSSIQKTSASSLTFSGTASTGTVTMVPYYLMQSQRYCVYWKLSNTTATLPEQHNAIAIPSGALDLTFSQSHLRVSLTRSFAHNQPIDIQVFNVAGVLIAKQSGVLPADARTIAFPAQLAAGSYMCSIKIGSHEFSKLFTAY